MSPVLKGLVALVAALFAVLGMRWMFAPLGFAAELGIGLSTPVALNIARGDLGGLFLAGSVLLLVGLRSGDGRWFQAVAAVVAFIAVGRGVGLYVDGFAAFSLASILIEVATVALLLTAASRT